mmetsp:Transcript_8206/g.20003  ORF Transcript_8206/g.20003 Transcript_8206/m.20003 type:complete len:123 (-) Transcript_8206:75-443(-)
MSSTKEASPVERVAPSTSAPSAPHPAHAPQVPKVDEITDRDLFLIRFLGARTPVIPLGCMVTAGILFSGFWQFQQGNKFKAQMMMRARVAAQGVTICLMMGSMYIQERQKYLGIWPVKSPYQ